MYRCCHLENSFVFLTDTSGSALNQSWHSFCSTINLAFYWFQYKTSGNPRSLLWCNYIVEHVLCSFKKANGRNSWDRTGSAPCGGWLRPYNIKTLHAPCQTKIMLFPALENNKKQPSNSSSWKMCTFFQYQQRSQSITFE